MEAKKERKKNIMLRSFKVFLLKSLTEHNE